MVIRKQHTNTEEVIEQIESFTIEEVVKQVTPPYIYTAGDLKDMEIEEIPKLWDPLFPKTGVGVLAGSSGVAKSYLLQQFATAVATKQEEFLGMPLNVEHGSVIYLSTEDEKEVMAYRMGIIGRKFSGEELNGLRFLEDSQYLLVRLRAELERLPTDLVVIDTFGDIFQGDINRMNIVRDFIKPFKNLAWKHNCFILFNHHVVKGKDDGPVSKDNLNGSAGIEGATRIVLILKKHPTRSNVRQLYIPKSNYMSDEAQQNVLELNLEFEGEGFTLIGSATSSTDNSATFKATKHMKELAATQKILEANPKISQRKLAEELTNLGLGDVGKFKAGKLAKQCLPDKFTKEEGQPDSLDSE